MIQPHTFKFDNVFDKETSQQEVYEKCAKSALHSALQGYNSTIIAYGQTGTGKTFTMEGFQYQEGHIDRGIVPRAMEDIFKYINSESSSRETFMIRSSYLQIYNEVINDLIKNDRTNLQIREDKRKGVFVEGLSEWIVRNPSDIYSLMVRGAQARATAATIYNDISSRSHAVFVIIVEQMIQIEDEETKEKYSKMKVGKLNMVDLAGSERLGITGASGKRLEECKRINQSLSALG